MALALVVVGTLVVGLALAWRFREELAYNVVSCLVSVVVRRYRAAPQRYANHARRLFSEYSQQFTELLPALMPLLGGNAAGPARAERVADYLSVEYRYRDATYVALLNYSSGPRIRRATARVNGRDEDVTEHAARYAGPCHDFHGQRFRPRDLVRGCEELRIEYADGTTLALDGSTVVGITELPRATGER